MAQLKDTVVAGNIRVTNEVLANSVQTSTIKIPTTSGSTILGPGTAGQVIKSDGTGAYWAADSAGVTSVTIKATSPIAIDSSAAITSTGTRTISHANSGATEGSYGDSTAQTPNYGGTFKVPYLSVNATGHVTSISEHTVKIPASDNTDTKVTAVGNHYAPAEDSSAQLSASASGATAAWSIDVVKGITIKRDAKGHVTGVAVTSGKIPANPNTNTTYTLSSGTNNGTLKLTPSSGSAQDNVKVTGWDDMATKSYVDGLVANATHFCGSFNASNGKINGGSNTLTSVAEKVGDMYTCDTAGTYLSLAYEVGDSIIFKNAVAASTAPVAADIISVEKTVSVTQTLTSGTKIGTVEGVDLYCQTNTDTKVTAVGNHYTPATDSSAALSASASGATAAWSIDVVKGVTLSRDAKGHVTGVSVTSGKIPANPNTDRYVNSAAFADDTANNSASPVKMTLTRAGSDSATVTANIPKVSSSSAGVAPKGAAVSTQSQSTKFLREDGSWAAPSYTTNTDTKVTSSTNHYTPATASGQDKTASASGATAAWSIDVVKGITLNTDGKGHVTGLSVTSGKIPANPNTDTKVNVTLGTTTKAYLLATSTTPTSTAQAVTSIADTGVYLGTTAGELVVTKLSASAGVNANTANSNAAGGLALYSNAPEAYGITMRGTATSSGQLGKHGYVQGDWAGYFCFSGATNRGYIFRHAGANVASINGEGNMVLNGSITLGGNSGNTSGCRQVYNSTTETLDFIFVS